MAAVSFLLIRSRSGTPQILEGEHVYQWLFQRPSYAQG
jgi:hypothetical protein